MCRPVRLESLTYGLESLTYKNESGKGRFRPSPLSTTLNMLFVFTRA